MWEKSYLCCKQFQTYKYIYIVTNYARPACERPLPLMATDSPTDTDNSVVVLLVDR